MISAHTPGPCECDRLRVVNTALLEALERIQHLSWIEDRGLTAEQAVEHIFEIARTAIAQAKGEK